MRNYLITLLLILSVTEVFGQKQHYQSGQRPKGSISGRVIDKNTKKPVLYCSLALYSVRDSSLVTGAMSGNNGLFTIANVQAGKYYMVVKFVGYEKNTISGIVLRPPQMDKNIGNIILKPAVANLEGVEITAEKTYVEYKIDRKVVNVGKDLNATGGTAVEALENVPSVTVDIDGNVQLRGSSSFTVFVNGKPTPLSGTDALEQIPVGTIKNIEIITNPSAKYDPDGMTGIINVVLKDNIKQGLNGLIDLSASNHNQYGINGIFSYNVGKFNLYFGGNYKHRNSPAAGKSVLENYFGDTTLYRTTDLDRHRNRTNYGLKGGFDFTPNKKNVITFEGSWGGFNRNKEYSSKIYEYNSPLSYENYSLSDNPGKRFGNYYKISANWEYKFDSLGSNIQTYAYMTNEDEGEDDISKEFYSDALWSITDSILEGNHTIEDEKAPDYRFKADLTKYMKNKSRIEAGLQARLRPEYHQITFESYSYDKGWTSMPEYGSNLNFTRNIYSGYITYSGEYKSLGYQLGLRGEETYRNVYDDGKDYSFKINRFDIFPTIHLSQKFNKNNQMLLSYSRRIDRPGGWELEPSVRYISSNFMRKGNPELEPEYMDNFELSYQKVINQSFVSIEGYYHTTKNKISRIQSVDSTGMVLMTFENLDRDHAAGIEVMLNARFLKWLNFNLSGNYYYYKLESNNSSLGSINNSSNNFDMRGNLTFRLAKNSKLQLSGFYRGASVTAQGKREPFLVTSAAFRQELFNKKISLSLRVRDIFSTMKFEFTSYGDNFMSYNSFTHASPVFTLNLTYRINNYKEKRHNGEEEEEGGGEEI